jgi:cob(I)alamin adenosyltransferase
MTQRIYTKTGDAGETGLFGGGRVPKSHPRVDAYGAVDELNAVVGWVRAGALTEFVRDALQKVQNDLFAIGAHLATAVSERRTAPRLPSLPEDRIPVLESWIDAATAELPELRSFILPGGSAGGATLHVARTVCRRAERRVVELARAESVADVVLVYLNRLSDLLFVLARLENHRAGITDELWTSRSEP